MHTKNPILPAGVVDTNVEFFAHKDRVLAMFKGSIIEVRHLPEFLLQKIQHQLEIDKEATAALNTLGITDNMERIEQFISCRFGAFNMAPDMVNEKFASVEYWDCGLRGSCQHEGKLCKQPVDLTKKEMEVVKLIANGDQDKEIADKLNMSINTIPVHKRNIQEKTKCRSKVDIAVMAIKNGLHV